MSVAATTVAERFSPVISDISPKNWPAPRRATSTGPSGVENVEEVHLRDRAEATRALALGVALGARLVLRREEHGLRRDGERDARALERVEDARADLGVGDVVGGEVGQPVAHAVLVDALA